MNNFTAQISISQFFSTLAALNSATPALKTWDVGAFRDVSCTGTPPVLATLGETRIFFLYFNAAQLSFNVYDYCQGGVINSTANLQLASNAIGNNPSLVKALNIAGINIILIKMLST